LLSVIAAQSASLPAEVKTLFPYSSANLIDFVRRENDPHSESFRRIHNQNQSAATVSEDGQMLTIGAVTYGLWDIRAKRVKYVEHFKGTIHKGKPVVFNVSQERYVIQDLGMTWNFNLQAIAFLDSRYTLCYGLTRIPDSQRGNRIKSRGLVLALIDNKQRGTRPNKAKLMTVFQTDLTEQSISTVGSRNGVYTIVLDTKPRPKYLAINVRTLATKWVAKPDWRGLKEDNREIRKSDPTWAFSDGVRWAGKTYFRTLNIFETHNETYYQFWNGSKLIRHQPYYLLASSRNQQFAWIYDVRKGQHWLLKR